MRDIRHDHPSAAAAAAPLPATSGGAAWRPRQASIRRTCATSPTPLWASLCRATTTILYIILRSDCGFNGSIGAVYNRFLLAPFDRQEEREREGVVIAIFFKCSSIIQNTGCALFVCRVNRNKEQKCGSHSNMRTSIYYASSPKKKAPASCKACFCHFFNDTLPMLLGLQNKSRTGDTHLEMAGVAAATAAAEAAHFHRSWSIYDLRRQFRRRSVRPSGHRSIVKSSSSFFEKSSRFE